jgi:hypothetical protein
MDLLYIDGTTGGMLLQVAAGGLISGALVFKLAARNVLGGLRRKDSHAAAEEETEPSLPAPIKS